MFQLYVKKSNATRFTK